MLYNYIGMRRGAWGPADTHQPPTLRVQEFEELEEGADVYKLVGPILVKQSVDEAKVDVERRLDFIGGEMWVLAPAPPPPPCSSIAVISARALGVLWHTHTLCSSVVYRVGEGFPLGVFPPGVLPPPGALLVSL